jgi:hypothetical protein
MATLNTVGVERHRDTDRAAGSSSTRTFGAMLIVTRTRP